MNSTASTTPPLNGNGRKLIILEILFRHGALPEIAVVGVELVGPDVRAQGIAHPGERLHGVGLGVNLRGRTGPEAGVPELAG